MRAIGDCSGSGIEAGVQWLQAMLARNASTDYLRRCDSPLDLDAFRRQVPVCDYASLEPWVDYIAEGRADVLFAGRPCGWERTGGSSGGAKRIPYSMDGMRDAQLAIGAWLSSMVSSRAIDGPVYLATSPATRVPSSIGGVPVGLPDGAWLGDQWGAWVARRSVIVAQTASLTDIDAWREQTLRALREARDLALISVWSPTFLLRLLDELPDPGTLWPRLALVSCWASGSSRPHADELRERLISVMREHQGNMTHVARHMGKSRTQIYRWVQEFGIDPKEYRA